VVGKSEKPQHKLGGYGCLERMRGCVTVTATLAAALCILSCLMEALVGAMMVMRQ